MHLFNPLQAPKQFCSFHSVIHLPHTTIPNHSVKGNQICLRSLLPFRCIPFRAVATCIRSRSLHSIASSFHQPPQLTKASVRLHSMNLLYLIKPFYNSMHSHPYPVCISQSFCIVQPSDFFIGIIHIPKK